MRGKHSVVTWLLVKNVVGGQKNQPDVRCWCTKVKNWHKDPIIAALIVGIDFGVYGPFREPMSTVKH